jgi:hypothetical protein
MNTVAKVQSFLISPPEEFLLFQLSLYILILITCKFANQWLKHQFFKNKRVLINLLY